MTDVADVSGEYSRRMREVLRVSPAGDIATAVLALMADVALAPTQAKRQRLWWAQQIMAHKARLDTVLPSDFKDDRHWTVTAELPETEQPASTALAQAVAPVPLMIASQPPQVVELKVVSGNGGSGSTAARLADDFDNTPVPNQGQAFANTSQDAGPLQTPDRRAAILAARDEARRRILASGNPNQVVDAVRTGVTAIHGAR